MKGYAIISIGRQFGSGGMEIGKKLAERLGFGYYDKELIPLAAQKIGFDPNVFDEIDEQPKFTRIIRTLGLGFLVPTTAQGFSTGNYLSNDMMFKVQSDVIKKLAATENCVVVGRCSDYVLRNNPHMVSIFLHASDKDRLQRICQREKVDEPKALKMMDQVDKKRAEYHDYYSSKPWGVSSTYHLSVDVSSLGVDGAVDFIAAFVERRKNFLKLESKE